MFFFRFFFLFFFIFFRLFSDVCHIKHGAVRGQSLWTVGFPRDARYGLRGVRVGEANNPGPRRQCHHRVHGRHRFASSSEDEFLVRPIEGRDVIPRTDPDSNRFTALADAETVPAGTQELEEVGIRQHNLDRVPETIIVALEQDLGQQDHQATNSDPRRRRIRDHGLPVHDLTLIDSFDDAPFVVTRTHEDIHQENIQPVPLLGRRLVLVPQSTGTPRSVQDRCDSSEDGVSRRQVEVRSHLEGTIPATELDSGAQLPSQGREFQSVREDTQRERRGGSGTADTSDTDSLLSGLPPVVPRRRLRLTWNPSHSGPQVCPHLFLILSWGWLQESESPASSKRIGCKPQKHCGQVGSLSVQ